MLLHARKCNSVKNAHYVVLEFVQLAMKESNYGD